MMWPETVSSWTMLLLSFERFIALRFPLQHRRLYRLWHTKALLIAILPFAFLIVLPIIGFALSVIPPDSNMPDCYPSLIGYYWLPLIPLLGISVFGFYLYPLSASLIFTVLIIRSLVHRESSGVALMQDHQADKATRRERSAGLTIVLLMAMELLIYSPPTISLSTYFVIQVIAPKSFWLQGTFAMLSYCLFTLTTIRRLCNLYIYIVRVPATRRRLLCRSKASNETGSRSGSTQMH